MDYYDILMIFYVAVKKLKLFSSDRYTKEGKGIDKNAPEKHGFLKFWEIAWAKKYKLIALNFLYFVPNIISVAFAVLSYFLSTSLFYSLSTDKQLGASQASSEVANKLLFFIVILFTVIPVFAAGPFRAGMEYILRCFTKREPCFLWTEYIGKTRSNLKLSIKACLINCVAGFLIILDFAVYLALSSTKSLAYGVFPDWMLMISLVVLIFLSSLFLVMTMYMYPMIVTFKLTLKQLYKNAMLFAFLKWLPNLGILLLDAVIVFIPLFFINGDWSLYISLILYALITMSFIGFINMSYTYPTIKKCLIDNYKADKSKEEGAQTENER